MIVARGDLVWITVVMVLIGILTFLIMLQDLVQMDGLGGSWRCFFAPRPLHEEHTTFRGWSRIWTHPAFRQASVRKKRAVFANALPEIHQSAPLT